MIEVWKSIEGYIRIFNSSEEAARELSINGSLIRACCRKEPGRLTYKGYEWRYV